MTNISNRLKTERDRLASPPSASLSLDAFGIQGYLAVCTRDACEVIQRVREVLYIVNGFAFRDWPPIDEATELLPDWFVARCAPEQSAAEHDAWMKWLRKQPVERQPQLIAERDWELANWLYWMEPVNRTWTWWNGHAECASTAIVEVQVDGWPCPWGSLAWLLRAAGASEVVPMDEG